MVTRTLHVSNDPDNPHHCILDKKGACLACALIEAFGEVRRDEALELAARLAATQVVAFPQLQPGAPAVPPECAPRPGVELGCGEATGAGGRPNS